MRMPNVSSIIVEETSRERTTCRHIVLKEWVSTVL
jgi:hypothetical protein